MKTGSTKKLRRLLLKIAYFSCYTDQIGQLEKALARKPEKLQLDIIGSGELSPDMALLFRSVLMNRSPKTQLITNARSTLQGGAVLVWLMGDSRKGRWLMEKAIKAGGPYPENSAWCRAELALMLWHDGALLPAEQQAEAALKQAPTNAHVLATVGKIKTAKKEYDKAIDYYQRAVEITATHDSLVALGDLYALTDRREEAEKQYKRVVDLHASGAAHGLVGDMQPHSHPSAQLARFYADHDRNLDKALSEARLAYRDYKNVFVADTLAWCYYKKGQYEEAGKTIRKALRWNTPDAAILFHAGMIQAKLGDRGAAQKSLYRALSLNPQFHPVDSVIAADTLKLLAKPAQEADHAEAKP
jgi:tetratricopeptide (TPR) repeat protein